MARACTLNVAHRHSEPLPAQPICNVPGTWKSGLDTRHHLPQELVLDDNRHGVDWRIPLQRCASLYKYNRDHAYYECKLMHLEWNRINDTLRYTTHR